MSENVSQREQDVLEMARAMLSPMQRSVVLKEGNRLITACPGAGKTRSIAARASLLAARGDRVALTSYTNVGADEMAAVLEQKFSVRLGEEHFVGTLHGFLLRFIFRPFAHIAMGCDALPTLRLADTDDRIEVNGWSLNPDDFKFSANEWFDFRGPSPEKYVKKVDVARIAHDQVMAAKLEQAASGRVTSDDAMYWCLATLRKNSEVCQTVAARFSEIIVDEAQDTSALQLACLRKIVDSQGLKSLFLVGDFDQSIYSFQGASPSGCERMAAEVGLERHRLSENYRSSQLICNVASSLRSSMGPDPAKGVNANHNLAPSVITYDPAQIAELPDRFAEILGQENLRVEDSAVIARGNQLVGQLSGVPSRMLRSRNSLSALIEVSSKRDEGLTVRHMRDIEDLVVNAAFGDTGEEALPRDERLRDVSMQLIEALPRGVGTLGEWHSGSMAVLEAAARTLNTDARAVSGLVKLPVDLADTPMRDFVSRERTDGLSVTTVHGVKGKSLDGVLLVADYYADWRGFESDIWAGFFSAALRPGPGPVDSEELRILYVALTRAERLCQIAVPKDLDGASLRTFREAGFELLC